MVTEVPDKQFLVARNLVQDDTLETHIDVLAYPVSVLIKIS